MATHTESLSHSQILKFSAKIQKLGAIFTLVSAGKCSGEFPAGLYPLSVKEDPSRMFAGEGGPERTNKRFHYVSAGLLQKAYLRL
jgi:methylmalonyl-CoA mutase